MSHSRHDNDTEIQPVPWVSEEGEGLYAEPSGQDLNQRLECVNASECISERENMNYLR